MDGDGVGVVGRWRGCEWWERRVWPEELLEELSCIRTSGGSERRVDGWVRLCVRV